MREPGFDESFEAIVGIGPLCAEAVVANMERINKFARTYIVDFKVMCLPSIYLKSAGKNSISGTDRCQWGHLGILFVPG